MEDLDRLKAVLKDITDICLNIKKETLMVMKNIKDEGEDLAKDIQEEKSHLDVSTILKMLQDNSLLFLEDATKVSEEIPAFSAAIANGKDIKQSKCLFMKEVWFGDTYDGKTEIDGLLALKKDLEDQLEDIDLDTVMDRVINLDNSPEESDD